LSYLADTQTDKNRQKHNLLDGGKNTIIAYRCTYDQRFPNFLF